MITLFNIALALLILFIISIFIVAFFSFISDSITMIIWPMGTALLSDIGIDIKVNTKLLNFLFFTLPMFFIFIFGVLLIQIGLCEICSYKQNPGKLLLFFFFYSLIYIGWNNIYNFLKMVLAQTEKELIEYEKEYEKSHK